MHEWTDIQYRDFYDAPRIIVACKGGDSFLFYSRFDDQLDEYSDFYEVYRMPPLADLSLDGSWAGLEKKALERLPDVPLGELPFEVRRPSD